MPFSNERISADDRKIFGLDEIDSSKAMRGRAPQRDWTIDRDRGIYLRLIDRGKEEFLRNSRWHFYWRGHLLTVCLQVVDAGSDGVRGGHGWVKYQLTDCPGLGFFVPDSLLTSKDEIVADLREALSAYRGAGIFSAKATFETTLVI